MSRALMAGRVAVALVWLYQGLWCKVLNGEPRHRAIVEQVLGGDWAVAIVISLGLMEIALALWVLSGWRPRPAAWVQTVALVAMNGAGLLGAGALIADGLSMLVMNTAFLALAWIVAVER